MAKTSKARSFFATQVIVMWLVLSFLGCVFIDRRHSRRKIPDSLAETLAMIEHQNAAWTSLKAKAKCKLDSPELGGPRTFNCSLAFKKNDNLRIVSNSLLGRDFDLLVAGRELRLSIPAEGIYIADPVDLENTVLPLGDDPGIAVSTLFQCEPGVEALRASSEVRRIDAHTWEVKAPLVAGSMEAIVRISAFECSITRCIVMDSVTRRQVSITEYDDFKEVSGITMPTRLVVFDGVKHSSLEVRLKDFVLDPKLHPAMFDLASVRRQQ